MPERRLHLMRGDARKAVEAALAEQKVIEGAITEMRLPQPYAVSGRQTFAAEGYGLEALKIRRDARRNVFGQVKK